MYKGYAEREETSDRIETLFRIREDALDAVLRLAVRQVDNPSDYERGFFSPWTVGEIEALCELKREIE